MSVECAQAALCLVEENLGTFPVKAGFKAIPMLIISVESRELFPEEECTSRQCAGNRTGRL